MKEIDVLWIILIILGSVGLTWFQYAKQLKTHSKRALLFAVPRCLAYICLGLLFLDLEINQNEVVTEKPDLIIGIDNSMSVAQLSDTTKLKEKVSAFINDDNLNDAFNINSFSFSEDYRQLDSLNFNGRQTNISRFLTDVTKIYRKDTSPILLFTDGQQTQGQDYKYNVVPESRTLIPVIVGDTTNYTDLKIDRLNANSYAFLNNQFPVEVFVSSNSDSDIKTEFLLKSNGKILAKKAVEFSENQKSQNFKLYTKAVQLGVTTYTAELAPVSEKNVQNNTRKFAVEVIDERTKILMVYDKLHPDIGMFKKSIANNAQKEFELRTIDEDLTDIGSFNLVILYQPNSSFNQLYSLINNQGINHIVVGGTHTDYRFLNRMQAHFTKNTTNATEEYYPMNNKSFGNYQQEELDVNSFPPLENEFGDITLKTEADILQYQRIDGFTTEQPLIMTVSERQRKVAYIFGENMWRWRMKSFLNQGDFKAFDRFLDQLIQFTSSNETKKRLVSNTKSFYNQGDVNTISVQYFDRNYVFDPNKKITLSLTNKENGQKYSYAFLMKDNKYAVKINDLKGGDYRYTINVEDENASESGEFKVIDFMIERTFYRANKEKLEVLSDTFFYEDQLQNLKEYLTSSQEFKPIQKNIAKKESLINWKILLVFIVVFLGIEWFSRKYYGLI